jgi:type IV pilus assembly protein PilW
MRYSCTPSPSHRGFSLIEMMVAITIGMFILTAMVLAYTSGKQTYRVQENLSRIQENGRFAIETIARDIRMADYNGCYSNTVNPVNNVNSTGFAYNFTVGIEGSEATAANTWTPTLDTTISGASPAPKSMTDVITVRGPSPTSRALYPTLPYMNTNAAAIHLDAGTGFQVGDVVVISDCSSADVFQITNMTQSSGSSQVSVVHNSGAGTPGNTTGNLSTSYGGNAELMKIQTVTYYIGASTCATATTPTCVVGTTSLWRKTGIAASEELAEGVDDMQILYGEDTDGDLTANRYVAANATGLVMKNVMSVRISLLLRTLDNSITPTKQTYVYPPLPDANSATITATDNRLRRILTTVVNLRNHTL